MEHNEPAAKRVKLERKCKSKRSDDLLTKSSSSSPSSKKGIKRKSTSPHTEINPLKLTDLNANCLIKILDYLELNDICAVAEVCVILKEIALKTFTVKFVEAFRFGSMAIPSIYIDTLVMVRRLLYNFGYLIRLLSIQSSLLGPICYKKLFLLIRKYCFETIENVVIRNEPISEEYLNFTGRIFLNGNFAVKIFDEKSIYKNQRRKRTH